MQDPLQRLDGYPIIFHELNEAVANLYRGDETGDDTRYNGHGRLEFSSEDSTIAPLYKITWYEQMGSPDASYGRSVSNCIVF